MNQGSDEEEKKGAEQVGGRLSCHPKMVVIHSNC